MSEEVEMDQALYEQLLAEGKSERIARAKAKAAAVRASKAAAGEAVGPREAGGNGDGAEAPAAAAAAPAAAARAGTAVAARAGGAALTPEERQARVAAALAAKGGNGAVKTETRLAGQEHTHRLLAMVPPTGIQQIRGKQEDKVYTFPHLVTAEFVALLAMTVVLLVWSALIPAPLLDLANANITPNPSKAPWYFMGLQELLRYFHPMIAGVTIPTIGIVVGMMIPYIDKNPSVRPENRKTAYALFTIALIFNAVLVIVGSFMRGPGFNWVWPWVDGMWFGL
jgi:menaquinol-cytochrome c reductase cytochrome b/c subunit